MAEAATPSTPAAETIPATEAAILRGAQDGNTSDYRAARRAERAGTPLAAVPAPAPTPDSSATAAPEPERHLSRRQQQINARAEKAVDSATAALREENARLKAEVEAQKVPRGIPAPTVQPAQPAPIPAAPAPAAPSWKQDLERYKAMPDAPKLAEFDTIEDFGIAQQLFVSEKRAEETRQRAEATATIDAQRVRIETFVGQLNEARTADPEFVNKLSLDVKEHVKPFSALRVGEVGGPMNIIGEQVYNSPIAPKVLLEFSAHPETLQRLIAVPSHLAALPAGQARARLHIEWMVKEYGKLEGRLETLSAPAAARPQPKTLTAVPAQDETLGTRPSSAADPKSAAIRTGNTRAYREMRRQERLAERGH